MTLTGHIENGTIVLDTPMSLPEGARVAVEVATPDTESGVWQRTMTPEEWITRWRSFCLSHPVRDIEIDDDRGSIYGTIMPALTMTERMAKLREIADRQDPVDWPVDASRDSIYE